MENFSMQGRVVPAISSAAINRHISPLIFIFLNLPVPAAITSLPFFETPQSQLAPARPAVKIA